MSKNTAAKKAREKFDVAEEKFGVVQEAAADKLAATSENLHAKADNVHELLSEKVEEVEDKVRKKTYEAGDFTQQTLDRVNKISHKAANAVEESSEYVRDFDVKVAADKIVSTVRNRPELTITAAGIFGLLIGFLVGRKSK